MSCLLLYHPITDFSSKLQTVTSVTYRPPFAIVISNWTVTGKQTDIKSFTLKILPKHTEVIFI
jgi:hypothetical protein